MMGAPHPLYEISISKGQRRQRQLPYTKSFAPVITGMKKTIFIISAALILAPTFSFAQVATSSIQLPAGFASDIVGQASLLFTSFSPYITLIVGILLALLAIGVLISYLHR